MRRWRLDVTRRPVIIEEHLVTSGVESAGRGGPTDIGSSRDGGGSRFSPHRPAVERGGFERARRQAHALAGRAGGAAPDACR